MYKETAINEYKRKQMKFQSQTHKECKYLN